MESESTTASGSALDGSRKVMRVFHRDLGERVKGDKSRERYQTHFEEFEASDGLKSIAPKE